MAGKGIKGITIQIGGQTTELDKVLSKTNKESKSLQVELKKVNKLLELDPKNTVLVSQKQEILAQSIQKSKEKLDTLKDSEKQVQEQVARGKVSQDTYRDFQREIISAEQDLQKLEGQAKENEKEMKSLEGATDGGAEVLNDFGDAAKDADKKLENTDKSLDEAADGVEDFADEEEKATKKTSVFGDVLKANLVSDLISASLKAITVALKAVADGFLNVVETGMEFDSQMSRVKAISGATEEEFEALGEQAKQLGEDTAFSATEAATGMENLASAGFSANETMAAMPGLLDLAAVSGGDVANATDVAASTLRAFALDAGQAGHVADVFARAAANTNAETADMGEAMKYVAPVAHSMGISIEETAAAIGIMSDAGIKGSQAGTALRTGLARLAKPTAAMKQEMRDLGISFYDSEGNMISLDEQMNALEGAFVGLTEEERNHALVTLYGKDALAGMAALVDAGPEKLDNLTQGLKNSDGAAADMAATMQDNLKGDLEKVSGSFETFKLELSEQVTGPLREGAQQVNEYMKSLTDAFKEGGFEGLVSEAGNVLSDILGKIVEMAPGLVDGAISMIKTLVKGLIDNMPMITEAAVKIILSLVDGLIDTLPMLIDGALQIILGLAKGLSEALPELIPKIVEVITQIVKTLVDNIPMLIDGALQLILGLAEGLVAAIPELIKALPKIITGLRNGLLESLPMIIDAGITLITALVDALPEIIDVIVEALPELIEGIISGLMENLPKIIDAGIKLFVALLSAQQEIVDALIKKLPEIINGLIDGILNSLPEIAKAGEDLMHGLGQGISDAGEWIWGVLEDTFGGIGQWFSDRWEDIKNAFAAAVGWFKDLFQKAYDAVVNTFKKVGKWFSDRFADIKNALSGVANFFRDTFSKALSNVTNIFKGIGSWFSDRFTAIKNALSGVANFFKKIFSDAWGNVKKAFSSVGTFFSDLWNTIVKKFTDVGTKIGNAVGGAFKKAINAVLRTIENIVNGFINTINGVIGVINTITGAGIGKIGLVNLPRLAKGGVLKSGQAIVAEAGPELISMVNGETIVTPLTNSARNTAMQSGQDESVRFKQTNNFYSPKALDPYETSRLNRNATRGVVLKLQGV